MTAELVRTMYEYNAWANQRILDTTAQLSPAQCRAPGGASFDSIHDTLVHTMGAQWLWLARWQGTSPTAMPGPEAFPDLAAIRARWTQVERDTHEFVVARTDADLARVVEYVNMQGKRWAYPLWQQMLHQVNHGTQHRSEVAMVLTATGHSPGWLDFLYFMDVRSVGDAP